jgi:hypothetical protein
MGFMEPAIALTDFYHGVCWMVDMADILSYLLLAFGFYQRKKKVSLMSVCNLNFSIDSLLEF